MTGSVGIAARNCQTSELTSFATADVGLDVHLDIELLTGRIGAEISSIDLATATDTSTINAIDAALVDHKVLFIRGQFLDAASHVAFANRLGTPTMAHPTVPSLTGHPHVFELDATSGARANVQRVTLVGEHARSIDGRLSDTLAGDPAAYLSLG